MWLRIKRGYGPARIAGIVKMPASTVHRVLVRYGLNRLDCLDRPTRAPIRRMEMSRPGEPVHVDVKKLGRSPTAAAGGSMDGRLAPTLVLADRPTWATPSCTRRSTPTAGSPTARSDEQAATAAAFWRRAQAFFASLGIDVERVLTDNGSCYRSRDFAAALGVVVHSRTRPYRPATNGKVERFNRTLLAEWAYARPWSSDGQRTRALTAWLHRYNHHRHHTAIGGPPISRVSNLAGQYS